MHSQLSGTFLQKLILIFFVMINFFLIIEYNVFGITFFSAQTIAIEILCVNGLIIYLVRKNIMALIIFVFVFYFNYSFLIFNYFSYSNSMFWGYNGTKIAESALYILLLFMTSFLMYFVLFRNSTASISNSELDWENERKNGYICVIIWLLLSLIFIFGFTRGAIGERGTPSSYYEYSVVLFLLVSFYSGKSNFYKQVNIIFMLAFALQNLLYAGRITALQIIILLYLLYFRKKINKFTLLLIGIIVFLVFAVVGSARGGLYTGSVNISNILREIRENRFMLDTAYAAFFTSETFIDYKEYVNFGFRVNQFFKFLLSMVLGGNAVEGSNLSILTHSFRTHYFGGILPYYFFFWFGNFGVVISSTIVYGYTQIMRKIKKNDLVKMVALYIVVTTPRWYLYSPSNLLRGVLILTVAYYILNLVNNFFLKE
ncbi:hypothetical protein [Enterococcus dispar]|uniref:hypothetical protein n=1 Tax=Enterococcus dispar TaxID=44009 RepID=UPI00189E9F51|nr:hypothetical protein [Enterococcus dispar]